MSACGVSANEDTESCVRVVKNFKTVQVPCTRNTYKQYTVKVPRQVTEQVPRTCNENKNGSCNEEGSQDCLR